MNKIKRLLKIFFSHFHIAWFSYYFWQYLLEKPTYQYYCNWWTRFWCRAQYHPEGPWYFNVNRTEPDMRCKRCYDEL